MRHMFVVSFHRTPIDIILRIIRRNIPRNRTNDRRGSNTSGRHAPPDVQKTIHQFQWTDRIEDPPYRPERGRWIRIVRRPQG